MRVSTSGGATKRPRTMQVTRKNPFGKSKSIPRTLAVKGKLGFPNTLTNTLRYWQQFTVAVTASGWGIQQMSCNNLYDPDVTGTGHQPHYYDQCTALYNHWRVLKSKCTVYPYQNYDAYGAAITVTLDDDSTPASTNIFDLLERPGSRTIMSGNASLSPSTKVVQYYNATTWFGKNSASNDSQIGSISSGPSETVNYVIQCTGTPSSAMIIWVELEYTVFWDELKTVGAS